MKIKRTKNQVIKVALEYAIQWEESFLDSMKGCKSPSDLEAIAYTERNVEDFNKLLTKMRAVK